MFFYLPHLFFPFLFAQLRGCERLETIYLEGNPIQSSHMYMPSTLALATSLTQLDANYITRANPRSD